MITLFTDLFTSIPIPIPILFFITLPKLVNCQIIPPLTLPITDANVHTPISINIANANAAANAAVDANVNPFILPLTILLSGLTLLALFTTLPQAPFSFIRPPPHHNKMPSSSSDPRASSSSSSKTPSSSSSSKPSSSSSSSSSSARPSSSSSSSSAPAPTPGAPQGPFISANAWMSFFLFCCLVLIILQGPLGLSGIGATGFPTAGAVGAVGGVIGGGNGNFGGFGMNGWPSSFGLGAGVGCQGLAATYVPWCTGNGLAVAAAGPALQIQQQQGYQVISPPQYLPQQPQAQVVHHHHAGPVVFRNTQRRGQGYGGYGGYGAQGSINIPGGGGQWSWGYDGQPRRQHQHQQSHTYGYPAQRQFQYQRPGLNVQVNQGPPQAAQAQIQGGYDYYNELQVDWSSQTYEYLCYHLPYLCQPIIPYAYAQPLQPQPPRRYAQPHWQHAQQRPYIAAQAQVQAQVQTQGPILVPQQVVPLAQPVATVQGLSPNTMMGIANLESAFFPLLVGAIALLVIFDYSS